MLSFAALYFSRKRGFFGPGIGGLPDLSHVSLVCQQNIHLQSLRGQLPLNKMHTESYHLKNYGMVFEVDFFSLQFRYHDFKTKRSGFDLEGLCYELSNNTRTFLPNLYICLGGK